MNVISGMYDEDDMRGAAAEGVGWGGVGPAVCGVDDDFGTNVQGAAAVTVKPHSPRSVRSCCGAGGKPPGG